MKKQIIPILLLLASAIPSANASTFLIDLNEADGGTYPGGTSAWNIYNNTTTVDSSGPLADTGGSSTLGITFSRSGSLSDSGTSGAFDNITGGPSWVTTDGSLGNTAAVGDYFFTTSTFTLTYGNLNQGDNVSLDLSAAYDSGSTYYGKYEYSLDGGTSWAGFTVLEKDGTASTANGWDTNDTQSQSFATLGDGNDAARYMNISGITIGADQTLSIRVMKDAAATHTALNAMRLVVIPEPGSLVLMGLGMAGIGLALRRR